LAFTVYNNCTEDDEPATVAATAVATFSRTLTVSIVVLLRLKLLQFCICLSAKYDFVFLPIAYCAGE